MSLILQMGYIAIATPDPLASATDLADIVGVRIVKSSEEAIHLSSGSKACEVAYLRDEQRGIRAVGLEVRDVAAIDEIYRRVKSEGLKILSDKATIPGVERAIRFATPFGPIFEIHTPVERQRIGPTLLTGNRRTRRLDHVNLRASDPRALHDLITLVLGMKLSDRTHNYERAWYRADDGFHHTLAVGPGLGLHHYGFDAFAVTDLVGVADTLVSKGRRLLWGIGRHGPGNNIFSYYLDPDQCVIETSFGMERIDNEALHEAGNWEFDPASNLLDQWGSRPPAQYMETLTPFVE